jgi:hypothetical protein
MRADDEFHAKPPRVVVFSEPRTMRQPAILAESSVQCAGNSSESAIPDQRMSTADRDRHQLAGTNQPPLLFCGRMV